MSHPSEIGQLNDDGTISMPKRRRTKALTQQARDRFEAILSSDGWAPGQTSAQIASELGLTQDQVRDAIFSPSADGWRSELAGRINALRHST